MNEQEQVPDQDIDPDQDNSKLRQIVEGALLAAGEPLTLNQLNALFAEQAQPGAAAIRQALHALAADCESRGVEVVEVASGWRMQVKPSLSHWISRLWEERPQRYSRALLETLALIAYRQPITRGEIEEVRGVSVSSSIVRTLQERDWIRVVGHRDVPGKPALFGTTRGFLDYFNLKSLDELPSLAEIRDLSTVEPELSFERPDTEDADPAEDDNDMTEVPEDDPTEEGTDEKTPQ